MRSEYLFDAQLTYEVEMKALATSFLQSQIEIKYVQPSPSTPNQSAATICEIGLPFCIQTRRSNDLVVWRYVLLYLRWWAQWRICRLCNTVCRDNKDLLDKLLPLLSTSQQQEIKAALQAGRVELKWKVHNWLLYYVKEQDAAYKEAGY